MQIKKSCITIIILNILFSVNLFAQSGQYFIPSVFPQSPNTAEQAKYGNYEVNLFTGLPDISIPLYTVTSGTLTIPITLSYHASGNKVTDVASWVGLGWSLSSGGEISRRIIGRADDGDGGYLNDNVIPSWGIDQITNDGMNRAYDIVKGSIDGRPDLFSYDFTGHSGKFMFNGTDHSLKPILMPFSPISINYSHLTGSAKTITGFDVNDEHGNSYEFGKIYQEITHSGSQSQSPTNSITSWMIEKMISQNKHDTVAFQYSNELIYYPDDVSDIATVSDEVDNFLKPGAFTWGYDHGNVNVSTSYVDSKMPTVINFKNGQVVFVKDTNFRLDLDGHSDNNYGLNRIKIYNYSFEKKAMELQKSVVFFKSYFNSGTPGARRLKLDSIQVLDKAGSIVNRYSFSYNESISLPSYGSRQKDYWGYYNGKNNTSLIPQQWFKYYPTASTPMDSVKVGDPNIVNGRDADSLFMQAAILTDIRYPTGGKTHFTYQSNQYYDNNVLKVAGGLRVASIASYTSDAATPIVKTYKYLSARPNFILDYCYFSTSQNYNYYGQEQGSTDCPKSLATKRVTTFVSNSTRDLFPWDAAPVAYKDVEEYYGTPTANIGKTVYAFTDFTDDLSIGSIGGTPIINSYFFKRGQLKIKSDYLRKTDGSYQIVKSESHAYQAFPQKKYINIGLVGKQTNVAINLTNPIYASYCNTPNDYQLHSFVLANYDLITEDNYQTSASTYVYDQNDPNKYQTSTVEYKYDNLKHQQVSRIRSIDSKGNTKITVNKYPADYLIDSATTTNELSLDQMLANNMQAEVIEKWDSIKNVNSFVNAVTSGQLNLYLPTSNQTVLPSKIKKLVVASPITNFTPSVVNSGNIVTDGRYIEMIGFDHYDYYKNLTQYRPRNANATYIIWDYNNALPIAQVKNTTFNLFNYDNISAYTSFEADGKGNWQFNGMPFKNRSAPTGAMVYGLNNAPITFSADLSKPHIISYWSDNGAATLTINGSSYPAISLRTVKEWVLYRHTIPAISSSSTMTISGNLNIDELKTYPADAQMTTYTYNTNGLAQTTDEKGQVTTYEYDEAQRLKNIKDWQGNIVKSNSYHNYNMTVGNDATGAKTFTRDNCPPNTVPGSTTYSVAANTYYSSTKASANALAQYDLNTNGQDKANDPTICGCPIQMVTFTATNSTGISTYQGNFTGANTIYMPINGSGNTTKQIPAGTYTLQIGASGTQTKNFKLGNRAVVNGRTATFNNVIIAPGSTDLNLSIY